MLKKMNKITIILPTLNEEKNINKIVNEIINKFNFNDYSILFVDDGSTDNTRYEIIESAKKNSKVDYLFRINDKDISRSFIEGLKKTESEYVILMDSDLQHDVSNLNLLIKYLDTDIQFINGSRFLNKSFIFKDYTYNYGRINMSKLFIYVIKKLLNINITDPLSGFFMIKRDVVLFNETRIYKNGWKIMLDIYLGTKNFIKFKEIPIKINKRLEGQSKINLNVVINLIKLINFHFKND